MGDIARQYDALLIDDLGSGALLDTANYGLAHEPMVQESLEAGADLVCFSGDKLLGGPQAGIILGKRELIAKIKRHPLARAVRIDKLNLAILCRVLDLYLRDKTLEIPVWRMIARTEEDLEMTAQHWSRGIGYRRNHIRSIHRGWGQPAWRDPAYPLAGLEGAKIGKSSRDSAPE